MGWIALVPDAHGHLIQMDPADRPKNFLRYYGDDGKIRTWLDEELEDWELESELAQDSAPEQKRMHTTPVEVVAVIEAPVLSDSQKYVLHLLENRDRLLADEEKAKAVEMTTRDEVIEALATKTTNYGERIGSSSHAPDGFIVDLVSGGRIDTTLRQARQADSINRETIKDFFRDARILELHISRQPLHLRQLASLIGKRLRPKEIMKRLGLTRTEFDQMRHQLARNLAERIIQNDGYIRAEIHAKKLHRGEAGPFVPGSGT